MTYTSKNLKKAGQFLAIAGLFGGMVSSSHAQEIVKSSAAGSGIYEAAINHQDGHIYVTSAGSRSNPGGALYKINPANMAIVDSILLKENPPFGIGINSKTQTAYTTNTRTNSVSAVDLKTGKLIGSFNAGGEKSHTREVLVDEENNLIYVSNVGDPSDIWVIDGKTNKILHTIPNLGKTATGMAFAKGTDKIYLTIMGENNVAVLNTQTKQIEKSFPSGGESPINIASDGKRLFVTNQGSGTLTVLDTDGKLIKSIETGAGAIGVAYDGVKNRIYSANRGTGTTSVIDGTSYAILADLPTGSAPNFVKIDKDGTAYVVNKTKGGRPKPGEQPVVDKNGDTLTKIN